MSRAFVVLNLLFVVMGCDNPPLTGSAPAGTATQLEARVRELESRVAALESRLASPADGVNGASPPPKLSGTFQGIVRGATYTVTFLGGGAFRFVSPANGQSFSGTYSIDGKTVVGDLGFGKEIYEIVDGMTLKTEWQGAQVSLKKQ